MAEEGFPTGRGQCQNSHLIVASLLAVAPSTCYEDIARKMEAYAIAVHSIKMFNHCLRDRKLARAIWAAVVKAASNATPVYLAIDPDFPILRDLPTQFVQEHADELIGNIGFGTTSG